MWKSYYSLMGRGDWSLSSDSCKQRNLCLPSFQGSVQAWLELFSFTSKVSFFSLKFFMEDDWLLKIVAIDFLIVRRYTWCSPNLLLLWKRLMIIHLLLMYLLKHPGPDSLLNIYLLLAYISCRYECNSVFCLYTYMQHACINLFFLLPFCHDPLYTLLNFWLLVLTFHMSAHVVFVFLCLYCFT